jgi:hypothetical protein
VADWYIKAHELAPSDYSEVGIYPTAEKVMAALRTIKKEGRHAFYRSYWTDDVETIAYILWQRNPDEDEED